MKLRRHYQTVLDALAWPRLGETAVVVFWLAGLAVAEVVGRASPNDGVDLGIVLLLLMGTAGLHSNTPLPPVIWCFRLIGRTLRKIFNSRLEIGIDFRQDKPVSPAVPPELSRLTTGLVVAALLLLPLAPFLPTALRLYIQPWFYLGYLGLMSLLWGAMLYLGLLLVIFGWAAIHDWHTLRHRTPSRRRRTRERLTGLGVYLAVFIMASLLPVWVPVLATVLTLIAICVTFSLAGDDFRMLWIRGENTPVKSFDGRIYLAVVSGAVVLATLLLMLATQGQFILGRQVEAAWIHMPVTAWMGVAFCWLAIPGLITFAGTAVRFAWLGMQFNPKRDDLRYHARYDGDHRQWEIDQRRHLIRGLKSLFKRKARLKTTAGTGVWIGLQHWYIVGMTRDTAEDDSETTMLEHIIGLPYHRVFSPETRLHFWEICRSVEVDLILVEDGVSFRRFSRVLRTMFETYDVYGGRQRCEELHFAGLPGGRVVLHEFDLVDADKLNLTNYPEPDYDELARARILHVFKDRGDDEVEPDWMPDESEDRPVLLGV